MILRRAFEGLLAALLVFLLIVFAPAYLTVAGQLLTLLGKLMGIISNSNPTLTSIITIAIACTVSLKVFFKI